MVELEEGSLLAAPPVGADEGALVTVTDCDLAPDLVGNMAAPFRPLVGCAPGRIGLTELGLAQVTKESIEGSSEDLVEIATGGCGGGGGPEPRATCRARSPTG